ALASAQLLTKPLGERPHGELGGRVHPALRPGHAVGGHRRHVHDWPRHAAPLHVLDRLARGDGEAEDVHLEHLAPELGRRRAERRAAAETGVVDQDVDAAEALARDREEAEDVLLAPHVGRLDRDLAAELRRQAREAIGAARGEHQRGAGRGERARRLRPDAARRAGDHGGLAGEQTCHGGLLRPLDPARQRCELTRMPVDLTAVGKKLGAVTHTYTERDVMLYALGVGCGTDDLRFTYERDLQVLPTFAVIPSFPAMLNLGGAMDVNPALVLHGEPDFAKLGGYDRPILHGLCTFGHAGRAVLKAYCHDDPARMKSLEVRFSGVVFPGETITTDMWQVAPGKIVLTARTERGEA